MPPARLPAVPRLGSGAGGGERGAGCEKIHLRFCVPSVSQLHYTEPVFDATETGPAQAPSRVVGTARLHAPSTGPDSVASEPHHHHPIGHADDDDACSVILTDRASARRGAGRLRSRTTLLRVASLWHGRASKNLPQMKQGDARRCTQLGPCGSQAVRQTFDLQARFAEIARRAERQAGRFEVRSPRSTSQREATRACRLVTERAPMQARKPGRRFGALQTIHAASRLRNE